MGFFVAISFLTILPLRGKIDPQTLGRSTAYFPAVGLFLGLILVGLDRLFMGFLPRVAADALLLIALIVLTGALHLDGLIDCCDALFGPGDPESRLARLKDPRAGAFGVVGAFAILLLKYVALSSLAPSVKPWALLIALALGRFGMVYAIFFYPYREGPGMGRAFKEHSGTFEFLMAAATAFIASLIAFKRVGLFVMVVGWLVAETLARFALKKLPGLTGDIYGAIDEAVEALVLLLLAGFGKKGWSG